MCLIHGELYAEIENHKTSLQEKFSQHIVSLIRKLLEITLSEQFTVLNNLLKEKLNDETYGATRKYLDEELGKWISSTNSL
jgi:flagellar biosynthesis/type III secretory pathway protein FliH